MRKHNVIKALLVILISAFLIIVVPIIINECYKANSGYITVWDAEDVLSYYGTILGSVVTVGALVVTILFTKKQIERDSYLKNQQEKWDKVQQIVIDAIGKNNPMRLFSVTIRFGDGDLQRYIRELHEFNIDATESLDEIKCYINPKDYRKIQPLISEMMAFRNNLLKINLALSQKYQEIDEASRHYLDDNAELKQMVDEAGKMRQQLIELHDGSFQHLLNVKREIFDSIYTEIEADANTILRFWGKKTNADA